MLAHDSELPFLPTLFFVFAILALVVIVADSSDDGYLRRMADSPASSLCGDP